MVSETPEKISNVDKVKELAIYACSNRAKANLVSSIGGSTEVSFPDAFTRL
jgi:hypothetical protein